MTPIKLITVTSHPEHAETLVRTAKLHGWDIAVVESTPWKGFGSKLLETYEYLKEHPEVERFVFADSFDVIVFGTPEEFVSKIGMNVYMLCSAEKGLWPPTLEIFRDKYPKYEHGFNFINSGLYYATREKFIEVFERCKPDYSTDDQEWMNTMWMSNIGMQIDHEQVLFNSHSHIAEGEYSYDGRIKILGNSPCMVHKNGRTVDPKLDELVKEMLG